jgi:hypothetical protein
MGAEGLAAFWISSAVLDVEQWLEAWLVGDEIPAATLPSQDDRRRRIWYVLALSRERNVVSFDGLSRWLDQQLKS